MTNAMRKLELREKIQKSARAVFLAKGYAETKICDIAEAAGISPSTIYLYFSGKKDLFTSLNIQQAADIRPEFERKREDICRAALVVFGQEGFERTTMDAIAERVHISKAALYQYCTSKEDLFLQVLEYHISSGIRKPDDHRTDDFSLTAYLRAVATSCLSGARKPERNAFLGTVIRDSNKFPGFGSAYYQHSYCTARENLVRFLRLKQAQGTVRPDADIAGATNVFMGSLMSYVLIYHIMGGVECDVPEADYIDNAVEIFSRALKP